MRGKKHTHILNKMSSTKRAIAEVTVFEESATKKGLCMVVKRTNIHFISFFSHSDYLLHIIFVTRYLWMSSHRCLGSEQTMTACCCSRPGCLCMRYHIALGFFSFAHFSNEISFSFLYIFSALNKMRHSYSHTIYEIKNWIVILSLCCCCCCFPKRWWKMPDWMVLT